MKINRIFISCMAALLLCTSCNDFLNIEPQELLNSADYMNKEEQAEMTVTSLYNLLRITSGTGPDGIYMDHHFEFFFGSVASDDAEKGSTVSDLPNLTFIGSYTMNPTNSLCRGYYTHGWWGISRANYILGHLDEATLPENLKNRMRGEVHFFKAYYYFYLLRHFGGVPILEHSVELSEFGKIPRASYTETLDYIIKEFQEAINLLPERSQYAASDLDALPGALHAPIWHASRCCAWVSTPDSINPRGRMYTTKLRPSSTAANTACIPTTPNCLKKPSASPANPSSKSAQSPARAASSSASGVYRPAARRFLPAS